MRRCMVFSCVLAALFAALPALAGDNLPPPWPRTLPDGTPAPNVTYQCWTFTNGPEMIVPPDPGWWNPHGVPVGPRIIPADPNNPPIWLPEFGGRSGVWCLNPGDMLEFDIPNWYMPPPFEKAIWVQIKHLFGPPRVDVLYPHPAGSGVSPAAPLGSVPVGPPGTPWVESAYGTILPFCPDFEVIKITALEQMYIDQVCIDTICIPAPGAAALLGLGGLIAARRRRD